MSETKEKPFPIPGTVWLWTGDRTAMANRSPSVVVGLRWRLGRVEATFDEGCADVEHMMTLDAWVCTGAVQS